MYKLTNSDGQEKSNTHPDGLLRPHTWQWQAYTRQNTLRTQDKGHYSRVKSLFDAQDIGFGWVLNENIWREDQFNPPLSSPLKQLARFNHGLILTQFGTIRTVGFFEVLGHANASLKCCQTEK